MQTDLPTAIALALRHQPPDLLVVAAAGSDSAQPGLGLEEILTVLRHTSAPVLVVPPVYGALAARGGRPASDVTRAVVATDFGEVAERAGQAALDILAHPAAVLLAHVEPPAISPVFGDPVHHAAAYRTALSSQFMRAAASLTGRTGFAPATVDTEILSGELATALWTAAFRWNADVIAVGTHKFTKLGGRVMGSVTKGLVQEALNAPTEPHMPVLLVVP